MPTGLTARLQGSFSAGMWRNAGRGNVPANGSYDLENCLLDDAGETPRRGGSAHMTSAAFGAGLTWLWSGDIDGVPRTLLANEADFGLLSANGASVTNLGGAGLHFPVRPALVGDKLHLPGGVTFDGSTLGSAAKVADVYAAAGGRLLACIDNRVYFSARNDPTSFDPTDYHELPDGVRIIGAEGARDRAALFTTRGVWLISDIELDLTDDTGNVQHRLDLFSRDLVLWDESGIAGWEGGLVVPAIDGVWLMSIGQDPASAPPPFQRISGPITDLYTEYVRAGYRPGGGHVFRSHYFLPILNGPLVADVLVCRLDRVVDQNGSRGWTRMSGHAGDVSAFASWVGGTARQPVLIGAQRDASARVSRMRFFETDQPTDGDGTVPRWQVITRDFDTGNPQVKNLVRRLRADYVLEDLHDTDPTIAAAYAIGQPAYSADEVWGGSTWGGSTWSPDEEGFIDLTGEAPASASGEDPFTWHVDKRAERARFRFRCDDASGRCSLRSIETFIRPSGRL
jgi:hypothetical protein